MKRHYIVTLCMGIGCLSVSAADRVAPVVPNGSSVVSGNTYYLYNVGADKFLTNNSSSNVFVGEVGQKVVVASCGKNYSVQFPGYDNYYMSVSQENIKLQSGNPYGWVFTSTGNGTYKLQIPKGESYYDANQYVGCKADGTDVLYTCTTGDNITWKLIDVDGSELYMARKEFYNLLDEAEAAGQDIERFEAIYNDKKSSLSEIKKATEQLRNGLQLTKNYVKPEWNNYKISFDATNEWSIYNESALKCDVKNDSTSVLTATVTVTEDATLNYALERWYSDANCYMRVLVDGKEVRNIVDIIDGRNSRFNEMLSAGRHTIEWVVSSNGDGVLLKDVAVTNTPTISVNLLEPGSLGTEVLYYVDKVQDVRNLKIEGGMNDEDWKVINMMKDNLFSLDLSKTDVKEIKDSQFNGDNGWLFLHTVKLPEGLTKIGSYAFSSSCVENVNFPSTLKSIGYRAFSSSPIAEAILPADCLELEGYIFEYCRLLSKASLPEKLTAIPYSMFDGCHKLTMDKLPSSLKTIEDRAFYKCYNVAFDLPKSLVSIGSSSFSGTNKNGAKTKLVIPENVTSIGSYAFNECDKYVSAELPASYYYLTDNNILPSSITTLRVKSPTVVSSNDKRIISDEVRKNIVLQVPSYLVNSYKLDEYWYNFASIEGFSTSDVDNWPIYGNLVLGARDRFENTPSVTVHSKGSLKVNGTAAMPLNNLTIESDPDNNAYGRMFSNADEVTVAGALKTNFNIGTANRWYFISLPYDLKVSDIVSLEEEAPKYVVRYYDGANRAANGATGSWKNYDKDAIIPAGTGFIFQASEAGWWQFPAQNNASKQQLTSNKMFEKKLEKNQSADASNSGWNLVGNPCQSWYNIHKLNFTAPITVRENDSYAAYSVIDDDYVIAPNQAFFIQCPDGLESISFPIDGRQMTSEIKGQLNVKAYASEQTEQRSLVDLVVSDGTNKDRTRVVLNDKASANYDVMCDASKFMSDNASVPQIYSYDNSGVKYAINERPENNGIIQLGFRAGEGGCFTFSLVRNTMDKVLLVDNEKGVTVDLTSQDYQFTADAGVYDRRFELRLAGNNLTAIDKMEADAENNVKVVADGIILNNVYGDVAVYTVGGAKVASLRMQGGSKHIALAAGNYVVKASGMSMSIVVK